MLYLVFVVFLLVCIQFIDSYDKKKVRVVRFFTTYASEIIEKGNMLLLKHVVGWPPVNVFTTGPLRLSWGHALVI